MGLLEVQNTWDQPDFMFLIGEIIIDCKGNMKDWLQLVNISIVKKKMVKTIVQASNYRDY